MWLQSLRHRPSLTSAFVPSEDEEGVSSFFSFQHSWQQSKLSGETFGIVTSGEESFTLCCMLAATHLTRHSIAQERCRSLHSWCAWDPGEWKGKGQLQKAKPTVWDPTAIPEPSEKAQKGRVYYCFCNCKCFLLWRPTFRSPLQSWKKIPVLVTNCYTSFAKTQYTI